MECSFIRARARENLREHWGISVAAAFVASVFGALLSNSGNGLDVVRQFSDAMPPRIAAVLATAVGNRGSMAEYLYATVRHLEEAGIHDPHLWHLQALVAAQIEAAYEPNR